MSNINVTYIIDIVPVIQSEPVEDDSFVGP